MSDDVCEVRVSPDVFEWLKGVDLNAVPKLPKITIGGDYYPLRPQPFEDFTSTPEPQFAWEIPIPIIEGLRVKFSQYAFDQLVAKRMKYATVVGIRRDGLIRVRIDGNKTISLYHPDFWEPA